MKKIFLAIILLCSWGCTGDSVYDNIPVANESIATIEEFFGYYHGELRDIEYRYTVFIDIRNATDHYDGRVTCFKQNIFYNGKESQLKSITNLTKQIGKKGYVFLIGSDTNEYVYDVSDYLIENGYLNVKVLSMGVEGFKKSLEESTEYSYELYWDFGECDC